MYNNQLKREKRKGEDEESERKRRKEERLLELEVREMVSSSFLPALLIEFQKNPSPEVRKYGSTQKCDDDEGHLIIKPGDYITHECRSLLLPSHSYLSSIIQHFHFSCVNFSR